MKEYIDTIMTLIVIPLLPIVSAYVIALIRKKTHAIEQQISNDKVNNYIGIAEDAVCTAVISVGQTYVDSLKKAGTFDQIAQQQAFTLAKQKAITIMGAAAQRALNSAYADTDAWLDNKIEYYVNVNKK